MDGIQTAIRPGATAPGMTEAEWSTRCNLAALYRALHSFGWTDLIYTHLSARVPGEPDAFLINHYGEMFDEVTASSLIKMNMQGEVLGGGGRFNKAGFTIHSGVYRARADVNCVMHTHTRAGATISGIRQALRPISQDVLEVYDELAYHDYGVPSSQEECEALGRSCAHADALILMNHGLLAIGPTIPATFVRMYYLERACQIELATRALDEPPVTIADSVITRAAERMRRLRAEPTYGNLEWESVLRMLDRQGVTCRV